MIAGGQPRWLLSFADLLLLLLACFIMLGVSRGDPGAVSAGMRAAFGAAPDAATPRPVRLDPAALFEPGEAVLRPGRGQALAAIGRRWGARRIGLVSTGEGTGSGRLDRFELAAARTAALARALRVPAARIAIEMRESPAGTPQRVTVAPLR